MRCLHRSRFTIIELIIAVGVFATLMALLMWSADSITASWQQLQRHNAQLTDDQRLDRTIDQILSNTVPLKWRNPDDKDVVYFTGQSDGMRLVYQHDPNTSGALRFCALSLDGSTLKLLHSDTPAYFFDTESVLAEGVQDISCNYFTFNEELMENRLSEWNREKTIPQGILIKVQFEDGRELSWFRRTPGNSYYEKWGEDDDEAI